MSENFVSQSDYAKHLGKSRQYVNKLVKTGIIDLNEDKKIDVAQADHALKQHGDPAKQIRMDLPDNSAEKDKSDSSAKSYADARATREQYQARMAELDYNEKMGKLLLRKDVEEAMVTGARKIQEGHKQIAGWADEICALFRESDADPHTVRAFLRGKVSEMDQLIVEFLSLDQDEEDDGS